MLAPPFERGAVHVTGAAVAETLVTEGVPGAEGVTGAGGVGVGVGVGVGGAGGVVGAEPSESDWMFRVRLGLHVPATQLALPAATMAAVTSAAVFVGFAAMYSAATPAAWGLAMDVPEIVFVPESHREVMLSPGA